MATLLIRSERVALPGGIRPASVTVEHGTIVEIGGYGDETPADAGELDAGALVVLPGLVDTHVHINDPGRADWEGFECATRAAAAGGVTTLVDMPLNCIPPTTTVEGLEAKRAAATGACHVDVGFWGGVVPGNHDQIAPLVREGVLGFKCFLTPSGVEEFEHVSEQDLRAALPVVASLGVPMLAHAELPSMLGDPLAGGRESPRDPRRYETWLRSRPPESEYAAIDLLIHLAHEFGARVHIVHLGSADALPLLAAARRTGIGVSVETCPHYLTFAAENIADGATAFKCAPPIRGSDQREGLWQGLMSGQIDLIATDHSPSPPAMKLLSEGDFLRAWGGISSLQLGLAVVWTGMVARNLPMEFLSKWLSGAPARLAGLHRSKGAIAVGCDGDFAIWDPDATITATAKALQHRHAITPYDGARLRGQVNTTILRGKVVFAEGECRGSPTGQLISRASFRHMRRFKDV